MNMALEAAHDVEVGDYYLGRQQYNGALQRYNDAAEEKPEDLAIHVRLGRAFEKLRQYKSINRLKSLLVHRGGLTKPSRP
jgi:outer membrane protein assembly factor BamD (BamD/ComL family)